MKEVTTKILNILRENSSKESNKVSNLKDKLKTVKEAHKFAKQ